MARLSPMNPMRLLPTRLAMARLPDEIGRVARGAGQAMLWQGVGLGLGYALHIALARWLGAAEYGVYIYVLAWASLLAIPAGLGLPVLVVRFVPEYRLGERWSLLGGLLRWGGTRVLGVGTVLVALAVLLLFVLDAGASGVYARPLLIGLWLIPLQALLNTMAGAYRGFHWIGRAYAIPAMRHAGVLVVLAVLWASGFALTSQEALGVTVAVVLLVAVVQGGTLWRRLPAPVRQAPAAYAPRTWLGVSIPLLLVAGFVVVLAQTDVLMVGSLLGPHEAGLYRAASRTAALVALAPIAIGAAADPMVSRLFAEGDRARLQRLASVAVRWAALAALAAALFFVLLGKAVLALFGEAFVEAYAVLLVLAAGQVCYAAVGLAAGLLNLTGHQRRGMLIFGGSALLNVGLNAVGILLWGRLGAALATATAFAVLSLALWWAARRTVGVDASLVYALRPGPPARRDSD